METSSPRSEPRVPGALPASTLAALAVAAALVGGSLYLSLGLRLKACPLCIYERTFAMAAAAVLAMGVLARSEGPALLALPCSAAGLGLAGFHVYLDRSGVLECPAGILGIGHAPDQSLAGFVVLTGILVRGSLAPRSKRGLPAIAGAVVLGLGLAFASIHSAPPLPPPDPVFGEDGRRILSGCEPAIRDARTPPPSPTGGKG